VFVSPDYRVSLSDQHTVPAPPELEAVFVGAAPANPPAFAAAAAALAAAAQLGFVPADGDTSLTNLPLAFASTAALDAAFPLDDGWLARAVHDYFNAGGLRAWVVRVVVDHQAPIDAFVRANPPIVATLPQSGVEIAMQVPSAGLLVLPNLEHLCLASAPPPATQLPTAPPIPPGFHPVADFVPAPPVAPLQPSSVTTAMVLPQSVLARVSAALAARRPDMLCLFALPVGADQTLSVRALVRRAEEYVHGTGGTGPDLPQVQAFAPLLRDANGVIASPSGLIAGMLAATAQTDGVWRSIAGRTLPFGATPLRRIESNALDELRKTGVAVLRSAPGGTMLDDDILAGRDVAGNASRRSAGKRRLMGWLLRNLQSFGEQLVFENVLDDGRVELILTDLFDALFQRGALNGRQLSDAVTITRRTVATNAVQFDIAVDIAMAVETIQLNFLDGALTTAFGVAA
jgi:hypothetical protein